ncbi:MAG: glycosyltransferase, partial [Casimicrobiaceae bacterium]
ARQSVRASIERFSQIYGQPVDLVESIAHPGRGNGHNELARRGTGAFILLLAQDVALEPDALPQLLACVTRSLPNVAAWEMRQIPYEHPKAYDPATGETGWVDRAAVLLRRVAFDAVSGFEPRIPEPGAQVDLSWRLRAKGWTLRYVATAAVQHLLPNHPSAVKADRIDDRALSNLLLRGRFGTWRNIAQGVRMFAFRGARPNASAGSHRSVSNGLLEFACLLPYLRRTKVERSASFSPEFRGWDYSAHRDGESHVFRSARWKVAGDAAEALPLVSILIRTRNRPALLRQALASVAAQTYGALEVIVIEDGSPSSDSIVAEFQDRLDIRFQATLEQIGPARAGNLALELARGRYVNVVDDRSLLFADHIEVLAGALRESGRRAAYSLAWDIAPRDTPSAQDDDDVPVTRHRQPFNRALLWAQDYLPLENVLFERSLYEEYGGFDPELEPVAGWELWIRYSLSHDFAFVSKTTTQRRAFPDPNADAAYRKRVGAAQNRVRLKLSQLRIQTTPLAVLAMADDYVRYHRSLAQSSGSGLRDYSPGR